MTIAEAITMADTLRPNQYTDDMKIGWLSKLDGMVHTQILARHLPAPEDFSGYGADTDMTGELLVPYPFDEDVYNYFLQSQIDKENGEIPRYNQSVTLFNSALEQFGREYHRCHTPVSAGRFHL